MPNLLQVETYLSLLKMTNNELSMDKREKYYVW